MRHSYKPVLADRQAGCSVRGDRRRSGWPAWRSANRRPNASSRTGLLQWSADGKGRRTSFEYDGNGNVTAYVDARGKRHQTSYNDDDKPIVSTDAKGRQAHLEYGAGGVVTATVSRSGRRTEYQRNIFGEVTRIGYGVTQGADGTEYASTVQYTYDLAGRPTHIEDSANPDVTLTWTPRDQLASIATGDQTISYNYDLAGRRSSLVSDGSVLASYGYDSRGLLTAVTQGGASTAMNYDDSGRRTGITYPGGYALQDALDVAGNVRLRQLSRNGTALGGVAYAYDALGRRVASWGSLDGARLPDALATGTFDDENQLVSRDGRSYTYDNDGRLLGDGDRQFTWNSRGQLRSVTTATGRTYEFGYDPLGRRTSVADSGGGQLGFTFDGWNELTRTTGGSTTTSANGLTLDDVFARGDIAQFPDANGTPVATGAADGTFSTNPAADVLGRPAAPAGASASGWKSGPYDGAGLIHFRNRYYDPGDGRFISQDPLGLNGGSANLYAFADGDPVNGFDPTGLWFGSGVVTLAKDVATSNFGVGLANGLTFGIYGAATGLQACGAVGLLGQWAGTALLGGVVGMVAAPAFAAFAGPFGGMILGGAAGGVFAYEAGSYASGQSITASGLGTSAFIGGATGPAVYAGAIGSGVRALDLWAPTPWVGPVAVGVAYDAGYSNVAAPGYGNSVRRKC